MPRFVVLEHDHPELHWDLMLEAGGVLRTWRLHAPPLLALPSPPSDGGEGRVRGGAVRATASFDHRLAYLDYEGPVSGGRGTVRRWDGGTFTWEADTAEGITILLRGGRLHGRATLRRDAVGEWLFRVEGPTSAAEEEGAEGAQGGEAGGDQPGDGGAPA